MRFDPVDPPREFEVGRRGGRLRHVADGWLEPDEVLTLRTESGTEVDSSTRASSPISTSSASAGGRSSSAGPFTTRP